MRKLFAILFIFLFSCHYEEKPLTLKTEVLKDQDIIKDNDTTNYRINVDDTLILVSEVGLDVNISDHVNKPIHNKYEKKANLLSEDSISSRVIGEIITRLLEDYKLEIMIMWYKSNNNKSVFIGCEVIFNINKEKNIELIFSLNSSDFIVTEKIYSEYSIMEDKPNLVRRVFKNMLNKRFQHISQKIVPNY